MDESINRLPQLTTEDPRTIAARILEWLDAVGFEELIRSDPEMAREWYGELAKQIGSLLEAYLEREFQLSAPGEKDLQAIRRAIDFLLPPSDGDDADVKQFKRLRLGVQRILKAFGYDSQGFEDLRNQYIAIGEGGEEVERCRAAFFAKKREKEGDDDEEHEQMRAAYEKYGDNRRPFNWTPNLMQLELLPDRVAVLRQGLKIVAAGQTESRSDDSGPKMRTGNPQASPASTPTRYLSSQEFARNRTLGKEEKHAFQSRVERWRNKHSEDDRLREVRNRKSGEAQYLYAESVLLDLLNPPAD